MATSMAMVPVRKAINGAQAGLVGDDMAGRLMAQWGIENATRISKAIAKALIDEKRRRKREGHGDGVH